MPNNTPRSNPSTTAERPVETPEAIQQDLERRIENTSQSLSAVNDRLAIIEQEVNVFLNSSDTATRQRGESLRINVLNVIRTQSQRLGRRLEEAQALDLSNLNFTRAGRLDNITAARARQHDERMDQRMQVRTNIYNLEGSARRLLLRVDQDYSIWRSQTDSGSLTGGVIDTGPTARRRTETLATPDTSETPVRRTESRIAGQVMEGHDIFRSGVLARVVTNRGNLNVRDGMGNVMRNGSARVTLRPGTELISTGAYYFADIPDSRTGQPVRTEFIEVKDRDNNPVGFVARSYLEGFASGMNA